MPGWNAPAEDELQSDFDVLPEDEYIAKITGIEVKKDQPNRFKSKNDNEDFHDMLVVKMDVLSFANGDDLVTDDDEEIDGSVPIQAWLNPKKVGMLPQPAKTRKFFAAALGQNIGDRIDIADFDALVGTQLIVSLKPNGGYNNAQDFRPIRKARRGKKSEDVQEAAKEIFKDDLKTNDDDLDF
jgi:hypothetical protein